MGGIDTIHYTAGPRGYRPRGKNVVRKYDLSQNGPRAVGSRDDPYYDPYEDPSYSFSFRTRTYNRDENANRVGDVNGRYSYIDDVGERHNVEFVAGKNTGFHVKTPFPDSNPRAYGPLYFRGRGRPIPRGRTSVQRGLDGSYKFVSAGPDQRRTETSDSTGHVRGSYTYLDDKGVQHSVHYIAGPETGYRVLKNVKGPHLPTVFPFQHPDIIPPDFYDKEFFDTAASGHATSGGKPGLKDEDNGIEQEDDDYITSGSRPTRPHVGDDFEFGSKKPGRGKPARPPKPSIDEDSEYDTDFGDLFDESGSSRGKDGGISKGSSSGNKPTKPPSFPQSSKEDSFSSPKDGSEGSPTGLYIPPDTGLYKPPKPSKSPNRPGGSSGEDYGFENKPSYSGEDSGRPSQSGGKPSATVSGDERKPSDSGSRASDDDDFGLFGSASTRPRLPYKGGSGPVITIGESTKECAKCAGAVVTNVGDTYLSVPPGVSVRAHVQAINLLPYSSRFPPPSEQFKADLSLQTEQLNAAKDKIVTTNKVKKDDDEDDTEESTTEEITTETVPTTFSSTNTTNT